MVFDCVLQFCRCVFRPEITESRRENYSNTMRFFWASLASSIPLSGLCLLTLTLGCGNGPVLPEGTVSTTANPQVAQYTITPPQAGTVTIEFGKTTQYGLQTATVPTPTGGGPVSIYVAGMQANTAYHMRAKVAYYDGTVLLDTDHAFVTGSYPVGSLPSFSATTMQGQTPQPGIEIVNTFSTYGGGITAVDLSGNVIWAVSPGISLGGASWMAPKQLANGDWIALETTSSYDVPNGALNLAREFDLVGNTVKQITMPQLNAALAAANYNLTLLAFSHDILVLPNGHWIVLAITSQPVTLAGASSPTTVFGDVIVDLDTNLNPVWVWNEFDHLDINRQPWNFPDWTHTNAMLYSPDDGNLLVSIRHQNWVVKVDYENGSGSGNILWRLGEGGDFKLIGGTDPTDWNYAQHGINFASANTTGIFDLTMMDNGDDRQYPGGPTGNNLPTCGTDGSPACYSTVPIFEINESNMTATLLFNQVVPENLYNAWGGNAEVLQNGDVEYDLCGLPTLNSQVFEVTNDSNPQTVWNLQIGGINAYRAYRLPSLYPGVQW